MKSRKVMNPETKKTAIVVAGGLSVVSTAASPFKWRLSA